MSWPRGRLRAKRRLTERDAWAIALGLPAAIFAAVACYSAAAGCYSVWMNCFSVVQPDGPLTRAMFFAARLAPFAFSTWALFAVAGYAALYRAGTKPLQRWLWIAPALFVLALHLACVGFAWTALPQRRITPTPGFDGGALAVAYGYAGLVALGLRWLSHRFAHQVSRRWASSRW